MKKVLLVLAIVGMFVMPMTPTRAAIANSFDRTDDWGNCPVHDVNRDRHMELLSKCTTNGYQAGGCRVYNVFQLEYGKDAIFSVSGHVYGEIESPSGESISQIITFSIDVCKSGEINRNFNVQLYLDDSPKGVSPVSPYDFVNNIAHIRIHGNIKKTSSIYILKH